MKMKYFSFVNGSGGDGGLESSLWGLSWRNHVVEKQVENTEKSSDILCKIMTR